MGFYKEHSHGARVRGLKKQTGSPMRKTVCFVFWLHRYLSSYYFVPAVNLLYGRQAQYRFKQVAIDGDVQAALLGLGQSFGNGQTKA